MVDTVGATEMTPPDGVVILTGAGALGSAKFLNAKLAKALNRLPKLPRKAKSWLAENSQPLVR